MNALITNPADVLSQMVADHLHCDTLTTHEIEELVMLLRQCATDRSYASLGRHCASALLDQLRGQLLARKHIGIAKGQP